MSSEIILTKQSAASVSNPTTGKVTTFVDTDGIFKQKDEAGVVKAFHEGAATSGEIALAISNHEAAANPHPTYETSAEAQAKVDAHANLVNNPHAVTKTQVGLSNVDNTSDLNKPISTATQTALDLKYDASNPSNFQTSSQVSTSVNNAITTHESALNPHPNYATDSDLTSGLALKYDATNPTGYQTSAQVVTAVNSGITTHESASNPHPVYETSVEAQAKVDAHATLTTNPHSVTKAQVGLGNVDNTSDLSKPVSTDTQTALNLKYDNTNPNGYETPAQLNTRDTSNRNRANHTGTQVKATISDFAHTHPLSELQQSGATSGQVATWNGSAWVPLAPGGDLISRTTIVQSVASVTPTTITELTSASLAVGFYLIDAHLLWQSTATTTGVGFRAQQVTAAIGIIHLDWTVSQAVAGTDRTFDYQQVLTADNVFATAALTANANFTAKGFGIIEVTTAGTIAIQLRSETGTSVSIRPGSVLIIKKVG